MRKKYFKKLVKNIKKGNLLIIKNKIYILNKINNINN